MKKFGFLVTTMDTREPVRVQQPAGTAALVPPLRPETAEPAHALGVAAEHGKQLTRGS